MRKICTTALVEFSTGLRLVYYTIVFKSVISKICIFILGVYWACYKNGLMMLFYI